MMPHRPPCWVTLIWSFTPPRTCFIVSSSHGVHFGPAAVPLATHSPYLTAPGEAGARRVGGGGGACATIWTLRVSGCDGPAPAATALLRLPSDASAIRVAGTASRASPTTAATQVARTQRGRIGERTPNLHEYGVRRLTVPGQRRVKGIRAGPGPGAPPVLLHFLAHTPRWL